MDGGEKIQPCHSSEYPSPVKRPSYSVLDKKTFKEKLNSNRKYKKVTDLYLQKRVKVPGVLIEVGFLSNPNDRYLLKQDSYQSKVADVITEATIQYFIS